VNQHAPIKALVENFGNRCALLKAAQEKLLGTIKTGLEMHKHICKVIYDIIIVYNYIYFMALEINITNETIWKNYGSKVKDISFNFLYRTTKPNGCYIK